MSIEELHAELEKLAPADLARVEALVREIKTAPAAAREVAGGRRTRRETLNGKEKAHIAPATWTEYWESIRGSVTLLPGWDEDEPLEAWEALHDDSPA